MDTDEDIHRSFKPPANYAKASIDAGRAGPFDIDALNAKDTEIWLIRVPEGLPLGALSDVTIPVGKLADSGDDDEPLAKITHSGSDGKEIFALEAVNDWEQTGEMGEFSVVVPSRKRGQLKIAPSHRIKQFNVAPYVRLPTKNELATAGQKIIDIPYKPRVHPEGLKMREKPYGHAAEGDALEESLKRYPSVGKLPSERRQSEGTAAKKQKTADKGSEKKKSAGEPSSAKKAKKQ
ncbi:DNA-directed RNA polymerase I, subunit RPA34.5 [Polychytrium aggregatum]|uniref:DNA-directed RNA polymerase I, subunit RPA34.5 n=1 Tax=Polychytrium aggregatum TaxID=110093 RepID=UPI0022FEB11E|nr:DNA-directed RNA polymerase I, subunit RPA34.5 [Polychytrium aggregatum]KAI9199865.1 DNA-directed RNA polymerase I, subunit RPA34.5 [Polychytrium aggregatum]